MNTTSRTLETYDQIAKEYVEYTCRRQTVMPGLLLLAAIVVGRGPGPGWL